MNPFQSFLKKHNVLNSNLRVSLIAIYKKLFEKNSIKLCYNGYIERDYDPAMKNVLLALESPEVIKYEGWIKPEMVFVAEISFANFLGLDNYVCCRDLYVNSDNFTDVKLGTIFKNKSELVSIVSSHKSHLTGHKLRHTVIELLNGKIDVFGSGYGKFSDINKAFTEYKFQIVIENGKYPEYVSEKFFNCLKTQTIPIYWGGEDGVRKMGFDTEGIIFFEDVNELRSIIDGLTPELYEKMKDAALRNMNRLIELRNEKKMNLYLNTVAINYMHTTDSYLRFNYNELNLLLDSIK